MEIGNIKSSFQLISTSVLSLQVKNNLIEYNERDDGERAIDVAFEIHDVSETDSVEQHIGILDLHVTIKCGFEDEQYLSIILIQRGIFTASQDMDAATFKKMLRVNGCASLYSIARATISSISSQLFSSGCVIIPMVNFIRFHELNENNETKETKD